MRLHFIMAAALLLAVVSTPTFACKCVSPPPGVETSQQLSEWAASGKQAIFKGRVEKAELKWKLKEARVGEVVPADMDQDPPEMEISFEVQRSYRGVDSKHVLVTTGIGGGDCGFDFETGRRYLVFAYKDDSGELSTGICSSTALLEESQANLAYLRGEPEIPKNTKVERASESGAICGHLVLDNPALNTDVQVYVNRVGNRSPVPTDEAEVQPDGSFCAHDLSPGRYLLLLRGGSEEAPSSFAFFPGVIKESEATPVQIAPGQTVSHLLFKVPSRQSFTVTGKIREFNKAKQQVQPKVMLASTDGLILGLTYSADVAADGTFVLRQVLPGKYWAGVMVESDGTAKWSTRKVEVTVDGDVSELRLELFNH